MVNYNKSTVVFSPNTTEEDRNKVCNQLGVRVINKPVKYLGMPMTVERRKIATFQFLLGKIEQKLQTWGNKPISKAGKVVLLKTAAQTIPNFWMSLFLIPKKIVDKIEKMMNAFWWNNGGGNRGKKWLAWDRICAVKEDVGLGFRKLAEFNRAILANQAWRLLNGVNPLVTRLMQVKYYPGTDFIHASLGETQAMYGGTLLNRRQW